MNLWGGGKGGGGVHKKERKGEEIDIENMNNFMAALLVPLLRLLVNRRIYLSASSEFRLANTACLHAGSPSWAITRSSSCDAIAAYRTAGSSYSSGDVK